MSDEMMRAMAAGKSGVEMVEIPKPSARPGEVRVRVTSSSVNAAEAKVIGGEFAGRFLHAKTKPLVVGWDFAGTVDALGEGVTDLEEGASVWGHLQFTNSQKQGTYAEFITIPRQEIALKPEGLSVDVAAASPTVTMTALQSLRDLGGLQEGGKVLIIGAAGGVGAVAVGIAKQLGAHVTAVCSTKDIDLVTALGADEIIDRTKADPLAAKNEYDVVFDTPAVHSYGQCAKVLRAKGAYVTTLPDFGLLTGMVRALFSSKSCHFVQVASKREDLELVGGWLADGLNVPIDSHYQVAQLAQALSRQLDRDRRGRVIVQIEDGW